MECSEEGLRLIKHYEGLRLRAYRCSARVLTIGYGHTAGVMPDDVISPAQADEYLRQDIRVAENTVNKYVTSPLSQHQFDALVSFVFNLGSGNFSSSTLLAKINARDYSGAASEFLRWTRAGGAVINGLMRRRTAEKLLFETPDAAS